MSTPQPPDIYTLSRRFRQELLQHDRAASSRIVHAYGQAWQNLQGRIDRYTRQMAAAAAAGAESPVGWFYERQRLQELQGAVEREITRFAVFADKSIRAEQRTAIAMAQQHMAALIGAGLSPAGDLYFRFAALNRGATEHMVGFLADGSPLTDLLGELGPLAAKSVADTLSIAAAAQLHPTVVARQMRTALGGNLVRAMTISRTETLRAYRSASLDSMRANADVVEGWIWTCAFDACPMCQAEDGQFFTLGEIMDTHPRCRCTQRPVTKSWRSLYQEWGLDPDTAPEEPVQQRPTGPERFAQLSEAAQLKILGPGKFALYQSGRIELEDLVRQTYSQRWGPMKVEGSISYALDQARRRGLSAAD